MVVGYVFIDAAPAKEFDIYTKLLEIPQIRDVHVLFGQFDLLVKIESDDWKQLSNVVHQQIRDIKGIQQTKTAPEVNLR